MALITQQNLNDASADVASLSSFVNGAAGTITTRLGRVIKNLAQLAADVQTVTAGLGITALNIIDVAGSATPTIIRQVGATTLNVADAGLSRVAVGGFTGLTSGFMALATEIPGGGVLGTVDYLSSSALRVTMYSSGVATYMDFRLYLWVK